MAPGLPLPQEQEPDLQEPPQESEDLPLPSEPDDTSEAEATPPAWMRTDLGLPVPEMTPEEKAAKAADPYRYSLTGGRRNSGLYQGQLIGRQREALAAWKETDNYRDAYLKKKKRRRPRPEWVPLSREYQLDAIMQHTDPSMLGKPQPSTGKPPDPYRSSEYKKETKQDPRVPSHSAQKGAYKSLEYRQAYPAPPIAYPGVPLGNNPSEGPWLQVPDSMWDTIWVSLKDYDVGDPAKREEFLGYTFDSDEVG